VLRSKEALQGATVALGPTKQPLPSFGLERSAVKEHGAIADNVALAADMPLFVRMRAGGAAEPAGAAWGRVALASRMHATKGTAAPLELHAREDVGPRDVVPPVQKGATDVPLAALAGGMGPGAGMGGAGIPERGAKPAVSGATMREEEDVAVRDTGAGAGGAAGAGGMGGLGAAWRRRPCRGRRPPEEQRGRPLTSISLSRKTLLTRANAFSREAGRLLGGF